VKNFSCERETAKSTELRLVTTLVASSSRQRRALLRDSMSNFEAENTELVCNVWIRNTDLSSCNLMFRRELDCPVAWKK
jgi:hypothetical protein